MTQTARAIINRDSFMKALGDNGFSSVLELHRTLEKSSLQISYSALMKLVGNKVSWNLTYAMYIAKELNTTIEELFELSE